MVRLHPDKLISLQNIVRQRRGGSKKPFPKRSYRMNQQQQDPSMLLTRLAYDINARRFDDHMSRLARLPGQKGDG